MPQGSLGAKKIDVAQLCRRIFLLKIGRDEADKLDVEVL
jgi:hypothetical protein